MPTISISSREDSNNRFMARSPARAEFRLPQRPIFLGALLFPKMIEQQNADISY